MIFLLQVLLMLYHLLIQLLGNNNSIARSIMKMLIDVSDMGVWHCPVILLVRCTFKGEEDF